jgi:hypothetical protein
LDPYAAEVKTHRHKRSLEDKESVRWVDAAQSAAQPLANAASIVVVGDRENDIYQAFAPQAGRRRPHHADARRPQVGRGRPPVRNSQQFPDGA